MTAWDETQLALRHLPPDPAVVRAAARAVVHLARYDVDVAREVLEELGLLGLLEPRP